jgi:hypothetical protein
LTARPRLEVVRESSIPIPGAGHARMAKFIRGCAWSILAVGSGVLVAAVIALLGRC